MNLYKVYVKNRNNSIFKLRFVIASNPSIAIDKYMECVWDIDQIKCMNISIEYLCKRDNIIPTVEPENECQL